MYLTESIGTEEYQVSGGNFFFVPYILIELSVFLLTEKCPIDQFTKLELVKKCVEQDGEHINVKGEVSYSLWFNLYRYCFCNLLIHVDNYI